MVPVRLAGTSRLTFTHLNDPEFIAHKKKRMARVLTVIGYLIYFQEHKS